VGVKSGTLFQTLISDFVIRATGWPSEALKFDCQ